MNVLKLIPWRKLARKVVPWLLKKAGEELLDEAKRKGAKV